MLGLVGMMERVVVRGHLRRGTHFGCESWCEFCEAGHVDSYCGGDKYLCVCFSLWEVCSEKRRDVDAAATQDGHRLMYVVGE